jgi:glycosyltransferase involved in cell wall biosynthesis
MLTILPLKDENICLKETVSDNYIVSAGRLIPEKGFDILIQAFKKISESVDCDLVILGEGKERDRLLKLIEELELNGRVLLPGFATNVYPFFTHARICVISSRIEGFPNVLLQMMACNSTVVSTLCAGGIEDIEGIITCGTEEIDELADAVLKALAIDHFENNSRYLGYLNENSIENYMMKINSYLKR